MTAKCARVHLVFDPALLSNYIYQSEMLLVEFRRILRYVMTRIPITVSVILLAMASIVSAQQKGGSQFLKRSGAELMLEGKPYRMAAINKFDLFHCFLAGKEKKQQAVIAIAEAARHGFKAIRFAGVGFYPGDMNSWPIKEKYWGAFDSLIETAKEQKVHLIPVINWNVYLFPDMAGECMQDMILNSDSRSRQYLWLYTHQIVTRYKNEPTVLFWELTNEMNLHADLEFMAPYGKAGLNPVHMGTSYMRLRRDHFTTDQMIPLIKEWAEFVRSIDKKHLISTGFSVPRPAAQHLRMAKGKGDWTQDNEQELEIYIRDTNPDPIDLISIHFYPGGSVVRLGNKDKYSADCLAVFQRMGRKIGKPVYIGETGDTRPGSAFTGKVLDKAVELEIPLILVWNWMSPRMEHNFGPNTKPEVIKFMQKANKSFQQQSKKHDTGDN